LDSLPSGFKDLPVLCDRPTVSSSSSTRRSVHVSLPTINIVIIVKAKCNESPKVNVAYSLVIGAGVVTCYLTLALLVLLNNLILFFRDHLAVGLFFEVVVTITNYTIGLVLDLSHTRLYYEP
jgi:hypothetical protein